MKKIHFKFPKFREPEADWRFMLAAFGILFIVVLSIDAYFAERLSIKKEAGETGETAAIDILDRQELDLTVRALEERSLKAETISETVIADPSI